MATYKSFAKRHKDELYFKSLTSFNGMIDGIDSVDDKSWRKTQLGNTHKQEFVDGVWCVGSSRDYFELFEDENFVGIDVYNCCGHTLLGIKKEVI